MSYESEFENEYKNYKDGFVQLLDELDEGRWAHEPDMRAELDEVYAEAAKTGELRNELRKQKGVLSGQMDVMEINLNYYKKQAAEYEAKAKAWDEALERWNDIENDTEEFIHIGNDPDLYYNDFRRVLKKYKRGEYHD